MESNTKKLKSSDNIIKEVDKSLLMKSKLLKGLIEDYQGDEEEIPLNEVDSKNLDFILQYLYIIKMKNQKKFQNLSQKEQMMNFLKEY